MATLRRLLSTCWAFPGEARLCIDPCAAVFDLVGRASRPPFDARQIQMITALCPGENGGRDARPTQTKNSAQGSLHSSQTPVPPSEEGRCE